MARVAAGVCCLFALAGLDVGIASRHWLTDGAETHSGLVQSQTASGLWWNTAVVHHANVHQLAFAVSGIVTFVLGALAGVLFAMALATSYATSRRCARAAQLLALSAAATAVAFVYLDSLIAMKISWSAIVFGGGVVATLIGASAARASARDDAPMHSLA